MGPSRSAIALRHLVGKRSRAPSAQRPSIIRAAMAVSRTRRTSLHHIGPSTTHNGSGVQVKRARFGIVAAAAEIGGGCMGLAWGCAPVVVDEPGHRGRIFSNLLPIW